MRPLCLLLFFGSRLGCQVQFTADTGRTPNKVTPPLIGGHHNSPLVKVSCVAIEDERNATCNWIGLLAHHIFPDNRVQVD